MVFEIDDQIKNYSLSQEQLVLNGIKNLCIGYREGNLLILASDSICDFFTKKLSKEYKIVLHHIKMHNSYNYDVNWVTKVVLDNPIAANHEIEISFFSTTASIQPTALIGENNNDAKFYFYLTEYYYSSSNIKCKFDYGGGSNSKDKIKNALADNNAFCLGIFDSDIKYPGCPFGGTYSSLLNTYNNSRVNIFIDHINFHEVENLIPFDYVLHHTNVDNGKKFLRRLKGNKDIETIMKYYDFKEGVSKKKISKCPDYYRFAEFIYDSIMPKSKKGTFRKHFTRLKSDSIIFPQINGALLDKFNNSNHDFTDSYYIQNEWSRLSKLVFTFICTRGNIPIN